MDILDFGERLRVVSQEGDGGVLSSVAAQSEVPPPPARAGGSGGARGAF